MKITESNNSSILTKIEEQISNKNFFSILVGISIILLLPLLFMEVRIKLGILPLIISTSILLIGSIYKFSLTKSKKIITISGVDESYYQIFDFSLLFAESRLRIEDFGEKIIIEKKIVNNIKENVLEEINNGLLPRKFSSMQNAIRIISKAITNSDYTLLQGFTLLDIYNTMQTIWSAEYEI